MLKKMLSVLAIITLVLTAGLALTGCDTDPGYPDLNRYHGEVFKGPFLIGSTVRVFELNQSLNQTGISYDGDIVSNTGLYDISDVPLSGPVEVIATGYFFDEVAGHVTSDQMTLRAITNAGGQVNINILTALERDRVRHLVTEGESFTDAKAQAITELLDHFGVTATSGDSTAITSDSPDGHALLTLSATLTQGRTIQDMQILMTNIRTDFTDGVISPEHMDDLLDTAMHVNPAEVRQNLQDYYLSIGETVTVPDFSDTLYDFIAMHTDNEIVYGDNNRIKPEYYGEVYTQPRGHGLNNWFYLPAGMVLEIESDTPLLELSNAQGFESYNGIYRADGPGMVRLITQFTRNDNVDYTAVLTVTAKAFGNGEVYFSEQITYEVVD